MAISGTPPSAVFTSKASNAHSFSSYTDFNNPANSPPVPTAMLPGWPQGQPLRFLTPSNPILSRESSPKGDGSLSASPGGAWKSKCYSAVFAGGQKCVNQGSGRSVVLWSEPPLWPLPRLPRTPVHARTRRAALWILSRAAVGPPRQPAMRVALRIGYHWLAALMVSSSSQRW